LTPDVSSLALVPARRGSIIAVGKSARGSGGGVRQSQCTGVPASVDDSNTKAAAIVLLCFSRSFE